MFHNSSIFSRIFWKYLQYLQKDYALGKYNQQPSYYALPILLLIIVVIILFFGLKPKTVSNGNDIHWLSDKKALSFHSHGIAYVDDTHIFTYKQHSSDFTIELSVTPENIAKQGFRAILMMHGKDDRHQLVIWQWGNSVIVMNGDDYDYSKEWPRVSAIEALTPGEAVFITITSGTPGARLFINGALAAENKNWKLTVPDDGKKLRLILGNSVYGKHGWEGEIYGVELHDGASPPERVKRDYDKWLHQGHFSPDLTDDLQFLYSFGNCEGRLIPDQTGRNQPLQLPSRLVMLKKVFLSSPSHNFNPNQSFFIDVLLNLCGFIPLGAVAYCCLGRSKLVSKRYEALAIVTFCFLLSLCMEILQAWLPGRTSSALDLILNTLGAWLGILLLNIILRTRKDTLLKWWT
jgi:VanZ family protein